MYICPLCCFSSSFLYCQDNYRKYFHCEKCGLVFVPQEYHLSMEEEKKVYDLHQNTPEDFGYRKFLDRLFRPLSSFVSRGASGLDFGCGPGPTLSVMFQEMNHKVALYDPFYFPDSSVLRVEYDFVTATEVLEHLREPADTLEVIWRCIKPGGFLGVMTKKVIGREEFSRWHYKNDLTHIAFFSSETFDWLAEKWCADIVYGGKDTVIFKKR